MNRVELKTVSELCGLKFSIPLYQRGYRWETQQVNDLLYDIAGFMDKIESRQEQAKNKDVMDEYYCLQPLAVKECVKKSDFLKSLPKDDCVEDILAQTRTAIADNVYWEVIDGQQRITTIYILLDILGWKDKFNIEFVRWRKKTDDDKDFQKVLDSIDEHKDETVDYHHIWMAKHTAIDYFKDKDEIYKVKFRESLLENVQFIWYESIGEDPVKVFTRLNIGKIALTNSELIKALILNRTNFADMDNDKMRLRQIEIASRWDEIETTLQNGEFWMFLHEPGFNNPTRIDFIFNLMCEMGILDSYIASEDNEKSNDGLFTKDARDKIFGNDKYRTFRYFNEFFHHPASTDISEKNAEALIKECWREVDSIFATFKEWFDDLNLYHYVGYLVACGVEVSTILNLWKIADTKDQFLKELDKKIREKISGCSNLDKQYEIDGNDKKTACRPFLLLHNIQTIIKQNSDETNKYNLGTFYKFPFHLYKCEVWNVEHIDSNNENTLEKRQDREAWLKSTWCFLDDGFNETKVRILDYFNGEEEKRDELFNSIYDEITKKIRVKNAQLNDSEKNKIGNFVLLDETTNKSYGNAIFPVKKMILLGKTQGLEYIFEEIRDENGIITGFEPRPLRLNNASGHKTAFVPPITLRAFLKAFNPLSNNPFSWDKEDAETYQRNIENTLCDFGVKGGDKQ